MDHVVGGGNDADLLAHGDDHRVVNLEQVVVRHVALGAVVGHFAVRAVQRRDEGNALTLALEVVVAPLPLVTGGLDGQVGVGRVLGGNEHLGGGQRHQDHDDEGNDGPDHLDRHGLVEVGGLVANRLAVLPDGIEHDREHGDEDHRAQDHHEVVQPMLLFGDPGDGGVQVELTHGRPAGQVVDSPSRGTEPGACGNAQVQQQ